MAVEADARVAVSVAEIASVFNVRSVGAISLLYAGPPLCGSLHQLLLPCFEVPGQGSSPRGPVGCQALP